MLPMLDKDTLERLPGLLSNVMSYMLGDDKIRAQQSRVAAKPASYGQGIITDAGFWNYFARSLSTAAITPGPFYIAETIDDSALYVSLLIQFSSISSTGRHSSVIRPTPALVAPESEPRGLQIPSGGGTLTFSGYDNIKNLRICAETGQTLYYSYQLYR